MVKKLPLSQGKIALLDDNDYEKLSKYKWYAIKQSQTWYAARYSKKQRKRVMMHHCIIGSPSKGLVTHHKDGNGLNNCSSNLEHVTYRENAQHLFNIKRTSKYPGVCFDKRVGRWHSSVSHKYKKKTLGFFNTEEEAYRAYLDAVKIIERGKDKEIADLMRTRISSSKYNYVNWDKRREAWRSRIIHEGKEKILGYFKNEEDAYKAHLDAKKIVENGDEEQIKELFKKKKTTSRYNGVSWNIARELWVSQIGVGGKQIYLGAYKSEEAAYLARVKAEIEYNYKGYGIIKKVEE